MQNICIIFNDRENFKTVDEIVSNVQYVFDDFFKITTCFMNEISENELIDGDVFLILYQSRLHHVKNHVKNPENIIVLQRAPQKRFYDRIKEIPSGANVLIVNDSDESTLQTEMNLYEIGINDLNFIPFLKSESISLNKFEYAITPGEMSCVPPLIKNVIDIGDRYIEPSIFIKIIQILRADNEKITANLIKYMDLIVESRDDVNSKYISEYLKNAMIKKVIQSLSEAVILTDSKYKPLYLNDTAEAFLSLYPQYEENSIETLINDFTIIETSKNDVRIGILTVSGTTYQSEEFPIIANDTVIGFCIIIKGKNNLSINENKCSNLTAKYNFSDIVYKSLSMKKCLEMAKKAALTDYTVLLSGESGTGKELIAQSIHNYSMRKQNLFLAINCAALPESLLESELFGYEKGAFTGAVKTGKIGIFEQADNGTIFLDEIGDMALPLQSRLLRVLQERQIMRIGSDRVININVRIIAATNKNLLEEIKNGNFRKDLFYRLNIIPIETPPLRERKEDIVPILEKYFDGYMPKLSKRELTAITEYNWPGNVRELKNSVSFYNIMGEFPPSILLNSSAKNDKESNLEIIILAKIHQQYDGIGRNTILNLCKNDGIAVSDLKLRKILKYLEQENLITVSRGRTGCRITEKGIDFLNKN